MRHKLQRQNGYFTVEAAMVLPVVLAVQMLIIYLFLFQYDRCLLNQDAARLAVLGCGAEEREKSALSEYLKNCTAELSQEKYVAWSMQFLKVTLSGDDICSEGGGNLCFPGVGWGSWGEAALWKAEVTCQSKKIHPVIWIRQCRKMKGDK